MAFLLFGVLFILHVTHGYIVGDKQNNNDVADYNKYRVKRILYGTPIKGGIWKSYVMIECHFRVNAFISKIYLCGGTLVSANEVVTAAHCVPSGEKNWVGAKVRLGYNGNRFTMVRDAKRVTTLGGSMKDNDFAILHLKTTVPSTNFIEPVELSSKDASSGTKCIAVGSGKNEKGQEQKQHPQQISLSVLSASECCNIPGEHQFCASDSRKGVFDGDSGSPLYCKENGVYKLYGITKSSGAGCSNRMLSVFSKSSYYKRYVKQ